MTYLNRYSYEFMEFAGVDNCTDCDNFTQVSEYERSDGRIVVFCKRCEDKYEL